jgi:hypothetical protein
MSDHGYVADDAEDARIFGEKLDRIAKGMSETGGMLSAAVTEPLPDEPNWVPTRTDEDGRRYWIDADGGRHDILSAEQILNWEGKPIGEVATQLAYSHRNGESTPPTVEGLYWYCQDDGRGSIVEYNPQIEERFEDFASPYKVWSMASTIMFLMSFDDNVQWWGPVTPPWE